MKSHIYRICALSAVIIAGVLGASRATFGDLQIVRLKYESLTDTQYLTHIGWGTSNEPPPILKEKPQFKTDKPVFFVIRIGGNEETQFAAAVDESKGTGKGYDRVYVDNNGNGRFDADESFDTRRGREKSEKVVGSIELSLRRGDKMIPWAVNVVLNEYRDRGKRVMFPMVTIGFRRVGEAKLDGQMVKVGLIDQSMEGQFSGFDGHLLVDDNGDGEFDMDLPLDN